MPPTYFVAPVSNGLGDLVCSLPVIQGLIEGGAETHLVLRSQAQLGLESRISGLAGTVLEGDMPRLAADPQNKVINLRDHPLQTNHVWGSEEFLAEFPNTYIDDIIATIARDMGVGGDFGSLEPLINNPDDRCRGKVLLVPASRGTQKCWPAEKWLTLISSIEESGTQCLMLGRPATDPAVRDLISHGVEWLETAQLTDALDAISAAEAVVGVDTGLTHLAVHQQIPTVALFRYNAIFARHKPHVRSLLAPKCALACLQKEFDTDCHKQLEFRDDAENSTDFYWSTWQCQEKAQDHCMTKIDSGSVFQALADLRKIKTF